MQEREKERERDSHFQAGIPGTLLSLCRRKKIKKICFTHCDVDKCYCYASAMLAPAGKANIQYKYHNSWALFFFFFQTILTIYSVKLYVLFLSVSSDFRDRCEFFTRDKKKEKKTQPDSHQTFPQTIYA